MNNTAKILLATIALAGSHQARDDDAAITGRYWFDNSTTHTEFTPGSMEIATDGLRDGLHTLNAYVEQGGKISSVASRCFLKIAPVAAVTPQIRLAVDGTPLDVVTTPGSNGVYSFELNTAGVREGLHQLQATADFGGTLSPTASQWFLKTFGVKPGEKYKTTVFLDGKPLQTYDTQVSEGGVMSLSLDMNALPLGVHTLQAQVVSTSGVATDVKTAMFMRMPSTTQMSTMRGYYTIDSKLTGEIDATISGNTFSFDFDASRLTPGLHSLSVYLASGLGLTTSVKTAWFIKIPLGGEGVKSYEYWINDNVASTRRVTLDKVANPFELISLVEIDEEPFRSTSYTFAIEEGTPVTYARNDFQVRFCDSEGRITMANKMFTDTRTRRAVTDIERITENIATLRPNPAGTNAIKWYQFEAEAGDSLALRFDRGAGYEVYAPDATLLLQASGADAVANRGISLTQTGTHYIAVHDVANGGTPTMYFTHLPRFAMLEQDVVRTANRGYFEMEIKGNGFNSLQKLVLSGNGRELDIEQYKVIDNYTLYAIFDLDENTVAPGDYKIKGSFLNTDNGVTEEIFSSATLTVEQPTPVEIEVEIETPRIIGTPYLAYIKVTNRSNVGVWGIPFNIAAQHTPNGGKIEFMDFEICIDEKFKDSLPVVHMTEDLLDTGNSGSFAPTVIPYLAPGKTNTYTIGLTAKAHEIITLYAWAGKPWSEEIKEVLSDDYDLTVIEQPFEGNLFSFVEYCKLYYQLANGLYETETPAASRAKQRTAAPARPPSRTPRDVVNAAAGSSKRAVGHAASRSNDYIDTRMTGRQMLLEMSGPNEYVEQMQNTDRGMLLVGNDLMAAGDTQNNLIGNTEALLHLQNARTHWKESVPADPSPKPKQTESLQSGDPNDMHGYTAPSGDTHIGVGVKTLNYTIEFENDPEIANAPASVIKVDNTLDGKRLDLGSFKPLKMIIGDKETELPAEHHFVKTLDMRPGISSVAELTFDYDATTGKAQWSIRSLDPMSMEPTKYMDDGVLPVNDDSGRGTGYLVYSIDLLPELPDGTTIDNSATIVFDDNDPISTPVWTNPTDYVLPTSAITSKTTTDNLTFDFTVEGEDAGSGIWFYDLYMRPAGSKGWILVKSQIESTAFSYTSASALEGADFIVLATDRAGNRQNSEILTAMLGDADGNGIVEANDVVAVRNYYLGESTAIRRVNADVSLDGTIDNQDATATRNLYLAEHIKNQIQKSRRK